MAEKSLKTRIQLKYDTETNWEKATNFSPKSGEVIIYATDNEHESPRLKVGDGITNVNDLSFIGEDVENKINAEINRRAGHTVYGFHIDSSNSDPSDCITYLMDAINMTPAYMDYQNDTFDYGSWQDAFFMPRPCMLKYDGTVDYYLDPNDYTKKLDGTESDISNTLYNGNAMMEWGRNGCQIWYKIVPDENDSTSASVYISDYQIDDSVCWPFINNQGRKVEHFYTSIYSGSIDSDGRLRSISGKTEIDLCGNKSAKGEITAAELNNQGPEKLWYVETYADDTLIFLLLILMGKSLNAQEVYGRGRGGVASEDTTGLILGTGTMDDKGLFYGSNGNTEGVKVFGMENFWGNQWRRYAGHILIDKVHKFKLTRGRQDGSTADDYNFDASGYLEGISAPIDGYITKMQFNKNGFQAKETGGSTTTYWCDYWMSLDDGVQYPIRGGSYTTGARAAGPFYTRMVYSSTEAVSSIGAALSCKPLSEYDITKNKIFIVDCGAVDSLPVTINNINITSDMIVVRADIDNPSSQIADNWQAVCTNGSITISGSIEGTTNIKLYLMKAE